MLRQSVCDTRVRSWVSASSSHYFCIYDCIQDMQPPWFRSVPESNACWNHTQDLFVSGTKNYFYRKHPAVIQKYSILTEGCLFIETWESSGPSIALLELSGTARVQLRALVLCCSELCKLNCCRGNKALWIHGLQVSAQECIFKYVKLLQIITVFVSI